MCHIYDIHSSQIKFCLTVADENKRNGHEMRTYLVLCISFNIADIFIAPVIEGE